jgi:dUTP pyrophosphatase
LKSEAKTVTVKVCVKRLSPDAKIPKAARKGDVAFDLHSTIDYELRPGERFAVPTGIAVEIPTGYEGQVRPRSGLALKEGITVLNTPGTIDSGYRGEVHTIMMNHGGESFRIAKGMRISQLAIRPVPEVEFVEVDELSDTERGEGGFGSTGR